MKGITVKSVLNKHRVRDKWFLDDYSINPYRGCGYGCRYCYLHGGRYGFKTLAVKINAADILRKELSRVAWRREYGYIALGTATEPWMKEESEYEVTRRCLEVILRYKFPVHALTKSPFILRDLDILGEIDRKAMLPDEFKEVPGRGVLITFSFSTLRDEVAAVFEPAAPKPSERLDALRMVKKRGFYAGAAFIPILPFVTDVEVEDMVATAASLNLDYVFFSPPTLYGGTRQLYLNTVKQHYPKLYRRYAELYHRSFPNKHYVKELYHRVADLCLSLIHI